MAKALRFERLLMEIGIKVCCRFLEVKRLNVMYCSVLEELDIRLVCDLVTSYPCVSYKKPTDYPVAKICSCGYSGRTKIT